MQASQYEAPFFAKFRPPSSPHVNLNYTGPPLAPRADVYISMLSPTFQSSSFPGTPTSLNNHSLRAPSPSQPSSSVTLVQALPGAPPYSLRDNESSNVEKSSTSLDSVPRFKSMGKVGESFLNLGLALIRLEVMEAAQSENKENSKEIHNSEEFKIQFLVTRVGSGAKTTQRGYCSGLEVFLLPWIPTWWKSPLPNRPS